MHESQLQLLFAVKNPEFLKNWFHLINVSIFKFYFLPLINLWFHLIWLVVFNRWINPRQFCIWTNKDSDQCSMQGEDNDTCSNSYAALYFLILTVDYSVYLLKILGSRRLSPSTGNAYFQAPHPTSDVFRCPWLPTLNMVIFRGFLRL